MADFAMEHVRLARREERYRDALREIRDNEGKVCDQYEVCEHRACRSSYTAWAIADAALTSPAFPRSQASTNREET